MIVIATAMDKEYDLINKRLVETHIEAGNKRGLLNGKDVLLIKTGIGKVNAVYGLTYLLYSIEHVEKVISVGCAGAAVPDLKVGDIVVGNSYCYHDVFCGEPNVNGQIQDMPAVFPSDFSSLDGAENYRLGTIATGDWFVTTREKVEAIKNFLPASYNVCAIDMESAALAQVCYKQGIPFVSIRAISDNPLLPTDQMQQYKHFWDYVANKAFVALFKLLG